MKLPKKVPLFAFRPQIKRWFVENRESQKLQAVKETNSSIVKNRREFLNFVRQIKKAQRSAGVPNENFLPWLKFMVESMDKTLMEAPKDEG